MNKMKINANMYKDAQNFMLHNYIKVLFESKHIVLDFNEVSKYITNNINSFTEEFKYIGWNWHISSSKCTCDYNENSGFPIYVKLDILYPMQFGYIIKRDLANNKIYLVINRNNVNDKDLESKINHEFTHVKTSYSNYFKDPLDNTNNFYQIKNIPYYINTDNKKYSCKYFDDSESDQLFNNTYFLKAKNLLYYISKTELEARINQTYKYIIHKYDNIDIVSIDKLIKETDNISLLGSFENSVDECFMYYNNIRYDFRVLLCIAYYFNQLKYFDYKNLTKENMLKYFNKIDGNIQDYDISFNMPIHKVIEIINDSLNTYEHRIYNIVQDAIYDILNNMKK